MTTKRWTPGNCKQCGSDFLRHGPGHLFCEQCSNARHRARQSKWARENPAAPDQRKRWNAEKRARALARGAEISDTERLSIGDVMTYQPKLKWVSRVRIPFSYAVSKNHVWATNRKGHVWSRSETKEYREGLTLAMQAMLAQAGDKIRIKQAKLWIDIFVQKPDHRGDAVNVVDVVCDALKDATGLDDRWYAIRRVDWQIIKTDPQLIVGIGQEDTEDLQICSMCGRMLTLDLFNKNASGRMGVTRVCRECTAIERKVARAA